MGCRRECVGVHPECALGLVVVLAVLQLAVILFLCILSVNIHKNWKFYVILYVGIYYRHLLSLISWCQS